MIKNRLFKLILLFFTVLSVNYIQVYSIEAQPDSYVSLLSHTGYVDLSGYYHVVGEVKNLGDFAVHNVVIEVSYFDIDDEFIGDRFDTTMLNIILSGRKSPFDIVLLDESKSNKVESYEINITYSDTNDIGEYIKILNHDSFIDESGIFRINGSIINLGEHTTRNIEIIATYYDNKGNIVAANYVDIDPEFNYLNPNQTKEFEILLEEERSTLVDKYELTAESSIYALIQTDAEGFNGSINVIKDAMPDDSQEFSFTVTNQTEFILVDDGTGAENSNTFLDLSPGSYSVTEIVPSGWALTGIDIVGDTDGGSVADLSTATVTIDLDAGEIITVTFTNTNKYTLAVDVVGGGSVSRDDAGPYNYGDVVELTASPDPGWTFQEWTGDLTGSTNPGDVTITGNMDVTANFAQEEYDLAVGIVGEGTVTKNPDQEVYNLGNSVGLTAVPADGWEFSGWTGDLTGSLTPKIIVMDGDKAVTATFERKLEPNNMWGIILLTITHLLLVI